MQQDKLTPTSPANLWKKIFQLSLLLAAFAVPIAINAQTATIYGSLSNFDVINSTEHEAHGFEIDFEGIQTSDVYTTFTAQRYGAPAITSTATGVNVRWASAYGNTAFAQTTVAHAPNTPFGGSCYQWGLNYNQSGCEHFGVALSARPLKTVYRWLIEDAAAPGTLIAVNPPVAIPAPAYLINPPAAVGGAPELVAQIEAVEPAEAPELYGNAQWVKVYKTELQREATLDELVSDNPVVPQDAAQTEVAWEILQAEPASNSNGNRRQRSNQGALNANTRSVIRRYEIYNFTGAYDPTTHQALCADTLCSAPAANEVGEFIGAQMAAANVVVPGLTVTKNGNGTVSSTNTGIRCGALCSAFVNAGTVVNLTATPASNNIFTGWTGACNGNQPNCAVTVNDAQNVTANFAQTFGVSVKTAGGKGLVTDATGAINCGRVCSTRTIQNSNVTLSVRPDPGFRFLNWSGACSGSALTCTVQVNRDVAVQANFTK